MIYISGKSWLLIDENIEKLKIIMGSYSFTIIAYILSPNCKKDHVMIHCIFLPVNVKFEL